MGDNIPKPHTRQCKTCEERIVINRDDATVLCQYCKQDHAVEWIPRLSKVVE